MLYPGHNHKEFEKALEDFLLVCEKNYNVHLTHLVFTGGHNYAEPPYNSFMSRTGAVQLITEHQLKVRAYRNIVNEVSLALAKCPI